MSIHRTEIELISVAFKPPSVKVTTWGPHYTAIPGASRAAAQAGYHEPGDIKEHTRHVLEHIKEQLESAGSSMEKVLKCNVHLNDIGDYAGMNEVFQGSFGDEPPVRTTVAVGRLPGINSRAEIEVIAYI